MSNTEERLALANRTLRRLSQAAALARECEAGPEIADSIGEAYRLVADHLDRLLATRKAAKIGQIGY